MTWFGERERTAQRRPIAAAPALGNAALLLAGVGTGLSGTPATNTAAGLVRGARHRKRGPGADRYTLLGRVRGKRWGELAAASSAGRHTSPRFVTDASALPFPSPNNVRTSSRPAHRPGVVIIATPSDLLAQLVATTLVYSHVPTCQLDPSDLAEVELEWHGSTVTLNGQRVSGLLWRTLKCPASSDTSAMDPMITASWLAAASFPSIRAINAYDADAWRHGAGWSVWEDRLGESGVRVQSPPEPPPTSPGTASLIVCGKVVSGPDIESVSAAAEALESSGVRLASVTSLPNGRISDVDTQPQVSDRLEARRAAAGLANYLAA